MFRVLCLCLLALVAASMAEDTLGKKLGEITDNVATTKDGATYCPAPVIGTKCNEPSIFHYYTCCGSSPVKNECCFNLQVWVIVVLAVIAVIMLASFVLSVIRCICCRR